MHRLVRHPAFQSACAILIVGFAVFDVMLYEVALRLHGNDFGKFYYSAAQWRAGQPMYGPSIASRVESGDVVVDLLDMNPPHLHLLVLPLTRLPLATALATWTVINALAALLAGWLIVRELDLIIQPHHVMPTVLAILASAATGAILMTGQLTGLLLVPLVLAWRAGRHGQWTMAAVWLGLLISIKPFLGLFAPYLLLERRWRPFANLVATLGIVFLVGFMVFGWRAHLDWIGALRQVTWVWGRMNGSLRGLLAKVLAPSRDFTPLTSAPELLSSLWVAGVMVVTIISLAVARRSSDHAFASLILGSLLISPLGWVYYLWLILPPGIALWRERVPWMSRFALVVLSVPYIALTAGQPSAWLTLTLGALYTWGTLLLWGGVALTRCHEDR